jgi:hypothetical protein
MHMAARVTLPDRETRAAGMRQHVEAVAESILTDHEGDAVFERYLSLTKHVRRYSIGNRMLMAWQAPDSRLVASKTAFGRIAAEQGHRCREFVSRKGRAWTQHVTIAAGAKAVWVWGPSLYRVKTTVTDPETGEDREELTTRTGFVPVDVWAIEDVRYADTGEPLQAPDFVQPVGDEGLFHSLMAFAAANGIAVAERGLNGARGLSTVGGIGLQAGDDWTLHVSPLIHELAHELMHDVHARLTEPGHLHEHEAEAVAAVVLRHFGHPTSVSASYLRAWGASPKDIIASMQRIADAAAAIVEFVEGRSAAPSTRPAADAPGEGSPELAPPLLAVAP